MSTRQPETPKKFTAAEIEIIESRLRGWLDELQLAREYTEKRGELWIFKAPSLQRALKAFSAFMGGVNDSLDASAAGQPVGPETSKSRKRLDFFAVAEAKQQFKDK